MVERLDQRGFKVAATSREQFQEVLGLRCHLEDLALRQSIALGGKDWEEALVLSHHRINRAERGNSTEFEKLHKDFHMDLLAACGAPILLRFCSQLYDLNVRYRFLAGRSKRYEKRDIAAEHLKIMNAAVERDADLASDLLLTHYRQTGDFLSEILA